MNDAVEWRKLGDCIEHVIDNRGKTPPLACGPTEYELIEVNALKGDNKWPTYSEIRKFVDQGTYETWFRKGHPQSDDVLFSTVGSIAEVALSEGRGCIAQNVIGLRAKAGQTYGPYLYYALKNPMVKQQLLSLDISSVQPSIKVPHLLDVKLPWPHLEAQVRVAHILGTLDDKIELNRQMNATLESMAQALFKSWFVDFDPVIDNALAAGNPIPEPLQARAETRKALGDKRKPLPEEICKQFPSSFVFTEEMGWVPEGWGHGPISQLCEKVQNGGTPKRDNPTFWDHGVIPWLTSGEVRQTIIDTTENMISETGLNNSSAKWLPEGSTVVAMYGATAGQVAYVSTALTTNQAVCGLIPKTAYQHFNYLALERLVGDLANQARGSAQQNISKKIIEDTPTIQPPAEATYLFKEFVGSYFEKWIKNLRNQQTLEKARDTLLPKLLSGQLRIPEAEQQLAEAL